MNGLVVDTSTWVEYFRGKPYPEIDEALKLGLMYLPPLVASELASGSLSKKKRADLYDFLSCLPNVDVDMKHWLSVGELRARLRAKGLNISTPDAHIAQCALERDCALLSHDKVFKKIAQVTRLKLG